MIQLDIPNRSELATHSRKKNCPMQSKNVMKWLIVNKNILENCE